MTRRQMFLRMLVRAAVVRPGRVATALVAVAVAATAATAMLNLYADAEAKLQREFRGYGANVVIVAREGKALPPNALKKADSVLGAAQQTIPFPQSLAAPFAYAIARTAKGEPVVVVGTDWDRARRLNRWWQVSHWPSAAHQALIGARASVLVPPNGEPFELSFENRKLQLQPAGTVRTGAAEDSRVYIALSDFTSWTGVEPSTIEVAASGSTQQIQDTIRQLQAALPEADVRPVRQMVEGEARALGKTRLALLAATAVIIATAALCLLATLTAWVFERRRDFAIMKALGASERLIGGFFAAQAATVSAAGALLGFAAGVAVAVWIGRANFHAAVEPRAGVLPLVMAGSVALGLISAILPVSLLRRIQPAAMLRGE